MIRLTIDNSMCRIEGLPIKAHKSLGHLLSYKVQSGQYRRFFYRSLLTKKGDFPTGLLYLTRNFLKTQGIKYVVLDKRKKPESKKGLFTLKLPYAPYLEQKAAAHACEHFGRGVVVAPTGVGKSAICALIINRLQVRTLIVVPGVELKRQLGESLQEAFGKDKVSTSIKKPKAITVENVDALDPKKSMPGLFDCVIIDEFHHSGAATYRKLNKLAWNGIYYKFGLTATPFRSQDDERILLESVLSKVIFRITYKTAIDKGYIVPVEAYYYELPKVVVDEVMWPGVYKELVTHREDRNTLICKMVLSLALNDRSVLCLVKEIAHGKNISSVVAFANGGDEASRRFIKEFALNHRKALIGTTGIVGEGVDTKPCEYVIIAGLGKSKNAFMQQVGRGLRRYADKESCKVILFYDKSHKWTREHFNAQKKILLDEYGVVPVKLDMEGLCTKNF